MEKLMTKENLTKICKIIYKNKGKKVPVIYNYNNNNLDNETFLEFLNKTIELLEDNESIDIEELNIKNFGRVNKEDLKNWLKTAKNRWRPGED